jgi:hypothetical protein
MSLAGTWLVVSSPDFDPDYLHMDGQPYVRMNPQGRTTSGEYHIGVQEGTIYGGSDDHDHLSFDFVGNAEMEPMEGEGTAELQGTQLIVTLTYRDGDEFTFVCERQESPEP